MRYGITESSKHPNFCTALRKARLISVVVNPKTLFKSSSVSSYSSLLRLELITTLSAIFLINVLLGRGILRTGISFERALGRQFSLLSIINVL